MDQLTTNELLMFLYYDIDKGFIPAEKLLKQAREHRPNIKLDEVRQFLRKQPSKEKKLIQDTTATSQMDHWRKLNWTSHT